MPDDPYANPYVSDVVGPDNLIPSSPGAADAAAERAGAFAAQHRQAMSGREKEIRDIQEKQQLNVDSMTQMLDDTVAQIRRARAGQSNLGLLEMGAAMMASPGNFGQQLGMGFKGLASGIKAQRDDDMGSDLKIADLSLRRATIANAPLEQRLAYMKALQTGDIAAMGRIEAMQIKAQAGGSDPAVVKEWRVWQQQPGNENKPLAEYQAFKAGLTDRGTALQREFDLARKDAPDLKWEDFLRTKAAATAQGRAQGESTGISTQSLPEVVNNTEVMLRKIDEILGQKDLDSLLGWSAVLPNRPGGPGLKLDNMLAELKSQGYLAGFERLKGAGAITDKEGEVAKDALMRLDPKLKPEDFKKQLAEARDKILRGLAVVRQKAGKDPARSAPDLPQPPISPPGQTGKTAPPEGVVAPTDKARAATPKARMPDGTVLVPRDGKWVPE
jgi:hypothetical protein